MSFTGQDLAALEHAAAIVNEVMDRHPTQDLRVVSALCSAVQDIRLAARYDHAQTGR
jgi:hypothetical protein